jgi:DNA helicase-2/ATP-dependent DNA helicase PcrA
MQEMAYVPTDAQQTAISSDASTRIVLGGAGTGKTVTAAAAARRHLENMDLAHELVRAKAYAETSRYRLPPQPRVLFLSFSKTAVAQVIDRAAGVMENYMGRVDMHTFHGFAWHVIANFGAGYGFPPPLTLLSAASLKVPNPPSGLKYDDLMPLALRILRTPIVAGHYSGRYSLVVCDEFQDTSADEWTFLQAIAPGARRLLLGDVNQCIYAGMKRINPQNRVATAAAVEGAQVIRLPSVSYRDPSGVLPAAAEAARDRKFDDFAINHALLDERLRIEQVAADIAFARAIEIVVEATRKHESVSLFTHTNVAATALSDALSSAGIAHEQVGFQEAYGEALAAQVALLRFALHGDKGVKRALAVYVAATHKASPLISELNDPRDARVMRILHALAASLQSAGRTSPDYPRLGELITFAYSKLGADKGGETWLEAARPLRSALGRLSRGESLELVTTELLELRNGSLAGNLTPTARPVQVMNLHQTKGREADITVLLLQAGEYHGNEAEPFAQGSRLLYVVMTRARKTAYILAPVTTHALWRPLVEAGRSFASGKEIARIAG